MSTSDREETRDEEDLISNDFDIFAQTLTQKVPEFDDVLQLAGDYGDAHRYVLQQMLISPSVSLKKFYLFFIKYAAQIHLKIHPEYIKFMKADEGQLRSLALKVINAINEYITPKVSMNIGQETSKEKKNVRRSSNLAKLSALEEPIDAEEEEDDETIGTSLGFHLALTTSEGDCEEFIVLVSDLQNSDVMKENPCMDPGELSLWWLIIDEAMLNGGITSEDYIMQIAPQVNNFLTQLKTNTFLHDLKRDYWIRWNEDEISLSPRTIVELEPYLKKKYSEILTTCMLCSHLIVRPEYTVECGGCKQNIHYHCFVRSLKITGNDDVPCVGTSCNTKMNKNEVESAIKKQKEEAGELEVQHAPLPLKEVKNEKIRKSNAHSYSVNDDADETVESSEEPTKKRASGRL